MHNASRRSYANAVNVKIGELAVSSDIPLTTIVGSCVACCIYDEEKGIAGMAHIMLPTNRRVNRESQSSSIDAKAKYADTGIRNLVDALVKQGADIKRLKAKIVGGARVFAHENDDDMFNIGERNIEKVREVLREYRIEIMAEDVGGRGGRSVTLDPSTMTIVVRNREGEKVL